MKNRIKGARRKMLAAAMLILSLTAVIGIRSEADLQDELGIRSPEDLQDQFHRIENKIQENEEKYAEMMAELDEEKNAAEDTTENAAADPGASASEDDETYISLAAMCDSEGNLIHIGPAFATKGNDGVKVYTESFGDEVASAFLTTDEGSYDLDLDTVQVIDGMTAIWNLKEPAPESDPAFLELAYPHQDEEAIIAYYAWENEKLTYHAETTTLKDCDEHSVLTVDYFPENMMYPAVLVNRDGAFVGLVSEDGKIICGVDQEIFYGSSLPANDIPEHMTESISEDDGTESSFNYENDLGFVVAKNSEGETVDVSIAVAVRTNPAYVYTETLTEEFSYAYLTTYTGIFDLDDGSVEKYENGLSRWTIEDSQTDSNPAFLEWYYAHQNQNATAVYYSKTDEELVIRTETVTLKECDEYGVLTIDHYPEDMNCYPAVLVNAENGILGLICNSGRIISYTDQGTFYGSSPSAAEGEAQDAAQNEAGNATGSAGETPAANPAVSVEPEEAVHPAAIVGEDIGKMVNTSAVQLDGDTYVLTSIDTIEDFDYQTQSMSILPEDLPENREVQIPVLPMILTREGMIYSVSEYENSGDDLPVVALYGVRKQDNAIGGLPVADAINPEHQLGYVFSYVNPDDPESENLYDHVWQDYILQYSPLRDNLYLIEDEIEYQDSLLGGWPGALIYDLVTHEAVGIGTYVDGKYAFEDITTILRDYLDVYAPSAKSICPIDSWGSLLDQ